MANHYIRVRCPSCRTGLKIPSDKSQKKICCPDCEAIFLAGENVSESASASQVISESRIDPSPPAQPNTVVDTGSVVSFESGRQARLPHQRDNVVQRETYWNPQRRIRTPEKKKRRTVAVAHPGLIKSKRKQVIKTTTRKREYETANASDSDLMTKSDETMNTIGVLFVLCAIFCGMIPAMGLLFDPISHLAKIAPAISMLFGLTGFSLICFAHRRKGLTVVTIGFAMTLVVLVIGWFGYWLQQATENNNNVVVKQVVDQPESSEAERAQAVQDRVDEINAAKSNPAGGYRDNSTPSTQPSNSAAGNPSELSNDRETSNPASDKNGASDKFRINETDDEYFDDPDDPFIIVKKPKKSQPSTEPTRSLKELEFRTADTIIERWRDANKNEPADFGAGYRRSSFAGNTNNGRFMYSDKPVAGVDFFQRLYVSYLTPVYKDDAVTSESIIADEGYRFAGLNLAFTNGSVVGVQGIFAQPRGNGLNVQNLKLGEWHGSKSGLSDVKRIVTPGPFVYGLIVNRRDNKVIGVGLINKK